MDLNFNPDPLEKSENYDSELDIVEERCDDYENKKVR